VPLQSQRGFRRLLNEEDAEKVFGIKAPGVDVVAGRVDPQKYRTVAEKLKEQFPNLEKVAITQIADWYANLFGFKKNEGTSSFFISGQGTGRIQVMKEPMKTPCHIAIRVSNFEEACKYLTEHSVQLDEPKIKKGVKAVFLKEPDKVGNRVHLFCAT